MKADNNIDKELLEFTTEVFKDYQVNADSAVWENISKRLEKRKKKAVIWWRYGAAASILMISGLAFWVMNKDLNHEDLSYSSKKGFEVESSYSEEIVASGYAKKIETSVEDFRSSNPSTLDETESKNNFNATLSAVSEMNTKAAKNDKKLPPANSGLNTAPTSSFLAKGLPVDTAGQQTESIDNTSNIAAIDNVIIQESKVEAHQITPEQLDLGEPVTLEDRENKRSNLFLAANMSSSSRSGGANEDASLALYNETTTSSGLNPSFDREQNGFYSEREFELPLLASVTFNYAVSRKWSLESGLSYSLLRAKSTSNELLNSKWERNEEIHYLGIPLVVNYILVKGKKLSAFSSLGIGIEKGILYRISENETDGSSAFNSTQNTPGFKYNLNTGIGTEYRFIPLIGIYLQPGVTYFSSTQEQPFDLNGSTRSGILPNLRLGLRFHLNN